MPRLMDGTEYSTTHEFAIYAGVSEATFFRWMKQGDIKEPMRDKRDWRIFNDKEKEVVYLWANRTTS